MNTNDYISHAINFCTFQERNLGQKFKFTRPDLASNGVCIKTFEGYISPEGTVRYEELTSLESSILQELDTMIIV